MKNLLFLIITLLTACSPKPKELSVSVTFDSDDPQIREKAANILSQRVRSYCGHEPKTAWRSDTLQITVACDSTSIDPELFRCRGRFQIQETYGCGELAEQLSSLPDRVAWMKQMLPLEDVSGNRVDYPEIVLKKEMISVRETDPGIILCSKYDTLSIGILFRHIQIAGMFPDDLRFRWHIFESSGTATVYEYIAVKQIPQPVDNSMIQSAAPEDAYAGHAYLSVKLKPEYHALWAKMTRDNVGKSLAMVLDGTVHSSPLVNSEITGGVSSVGGISSKEIQTLAHTIPYEPLPCKVMSVAFTNNLLPAEKRKSSMTEHITFATNTSKNTIVPSIK